MSAGAGQGRHATSSDPQLCVCTQCPLTPGLTPACAVAVEECPAVHVVQLVPHLVGCNLVLTLTQVLVAPTPPAWA